MFDHNHYVPVLQWKKGERDAVRRLWQQDKLQMTPLLEISARRPMPRQDTPKPKRSKPKGDWMLEMACSIRDSWGTFGRAFAEICPEVTAPSPLEGIAKNTENLFRLSRARDLKLVPVVRLAYDAVRTGAIRRVLEQDKRGVCIRVTRMDLLRPSLDQDLKRLLQHLKLGPDQADLVVDLHVVDEEGFDLVVVCSQLPHLEMWRSFTVVGGSFPRGLAKSNYGFNTFARFEWRAWSEQVRRELPRKPAFGDYTTQHPVPFDPTVHPIPCANIRYTTETEWIVYKGLQLVAKKPKPGDPSRYEQYPAMAQLIKEQPFYRGAEFSYGDRYIHNMAEERLHSEKSSSGNTTTWLTAGVNHHLTHVVIQIGKLSGFLSSSEHGREAGLTVQSRQFGHRGILSVSSRPPLLPRGAPTA